MENLEIMQPEDPTPAPTEIWDGVEEDNDDLSIHLDSDEETRDGSTSSDSGHPPATGRPDADYAGSDIETSEEDNNAGDDESDEENNRDGAVLESSLGKRKRGEREPAEQESPLRPPPAGHLERIIKFRVTNHPRDYLYLKSDIIKCQIAPIVGFSTWTKGVLRVEVEFGSLEGTGEVLVTNIDCTRSGGKFLLRTAPIRELGTQKGSVLTLEYLGWRGGDSTHQEDRLYCFHLRNTGIIRKPSCIDDDEDLQACLQESHHADSETDHEDGYECSEVSEGSGRSEGDSADESEGGNLKGSGGHQAEIGQLIPPRRGAQTVFEIETRLKLRDNIYAKPQQVYKPLMRALGLKGVQSITVELSVGPSKKWLGAFMLWRDRGGANLRDQCRLKKELELKGGDIVVLTYVGHRVSRSGKKVYCFTAKKKESELRKEPRNAIVRHEVSPKKRESATETAVNVEKAGVESLLKLDLVRPAPDCRIRHAIEITAKIDRPSLYLKSKVFEQILTESLHVDSPLPEGKTVPCKVFAVRNDVIQGELACVMRRDREGSNGGDLSCGGALLEALRAEKGDTIRFIYLGYKPADTSCEVKKKIYYFKVDKWKDPTGKVLVHASGAVHSPRKSTPTVPPSSARPYLSASPAKPYGVNRPAKQRRLLQKFVSRGKVTPAAPAAQKSDSPRDSRRHAAPVTPVGMSNAAPQRDTGRINGEKLGSVGAIGAGAVGRGLGHNVGHRKESANLDAARNDRVVALPPSPVPVNIAGARGINEAEALMKEFAAGGSAALPSAQAQQAAQRYSIIMGTVISKRAVEAVDGNCLFIEGGPNSLPGFEYSDRSRWCGSEVPSVDATGVRLLRASGARNCSSSLASVFQGKAAFKLWLGKVQAGVTTNACFGVVALDDIPAGSWIMQWTGDYVMSHNARHQDSSGAVIELQDAVVPVHAAITKAQQAQCTGLSAPTKFVGSANSHWKRLPNTAINSCNYGNAARFVRRCSDPNVGCMEIDMPTGPTGMFLFAMRDIAKGEELTMLS